MSLGTSAELAGMRRGAFVEHLQAHGIPLARPVPEEWEHNLAHRG
jgi:predicted HTH domain antitoxin